MSRHERFDGRQTMKNSTYEVFRYKDDYPKEVALHHHDFYEIYFFLSGNVKYNIESRNEHFTQEDGVWYRNGEVWRKCIDKTTGVIVDEKLLKRNHARVMYDEKYISQHGFC